MCNLHLFTGAKIKIVPPECLARNNQIFKDFLNIHGKSKIRDVLVKVENRNQDAQKKNIFSKRKYSCLMGFRNDKEKY